MKLKKMLVALAHAIADEAARNPEFKAQIDSILGSGNAPLALGFGQPRRKGGRRAPAVLDPIEHARRGEGVLRTKLAELDLEKLRDIVAQYGMDPGKLVMKWKDTNRVIDRIVEIAVTRATKGDAFRSD